MPIIPQVTCRRCQRQYSALRGRCPHCGTRKAKQSGRTVADTASVREGTTSGARAVSNSRWQFIFGVILLVAVIASVITLISMSLSDGGPSARATPTPSLTVEETQSPTMTVTPSTPTPPPVTAITIAYLGSERKEFMVYIDAATPIEAILYPVELGPEVEVKWSVSDDSIFRIEETGHNKIDVYGVSKGQATLTAACGGVTQTCTVYSG